ISDPQRVRILVFRQPYSGNHVSRGVEDRKCFLREGVKVDNGDLLSRNERESQSPACPRFTPATGSFAARAITPAASSIALSAWAPTTMQSSSVPFSVQMTLGVRDPPSRAALSIVPERTPPSRTTRAELVRAPCFCPSLGSAALHKIGGATLSYSIFCAVMG